VKHTKQILEAGLPLREAKKTLIMVHGRGGTARDIIALKKELSVDDFYIVAPQATNKGISTNNIFLLGFSQGACLALEFAARYAQHWGGVIAFTGGLIGSKLESEIYKGDLSGTKIFIGNSDIDPHVPMSRSDESKHIMEGLGASVNLKIYPNMPHTINEDEINEANKILQQ
jgi:phospholipase/carboxylesterase